MGNTCSCCKKTETQITKLNKDEHKVYKELKTKMKLHSSIQAREKRKPVI
jgi:hypothetical protein